MRQLLLLCRVQEIRAGYTSDKWFHPTIFLHNNPLRSLPQGCTSEQTQQEEQRALPRRVVKFYLCRGADVCSIPIYYTAALGTRRANFRDHLARIFGFARTRTAVRQTIQIYLLWGVSYT